EAVHLPRAGCSEIIIEKVRPWQRGVIPDKSFKSGVFPCKNTIAVGSAVVEMSVCIDDCCPAGERGSCHLLGLQRVPGGAGCRRCRRIVFSKFRGCVSVYAGRVKSGAGNLGKAAAHVRFAPIADMSMRSSRTPLCARSRHSHCSDFLITMSARTPPIQQVRERSARTLLSESIGVHALDLPVGCPRARRIAADHARAVEQPDYELAGCGVVPEDVALAVAVEIAGFRDGKRTHGRSG